MDDNDITEFVLEQLLGTDSAEAFQAACPEIPLPVAHSLFSLSRAQQQQQQQLQESTPRLDMGAKRQKSGGAGLPQNLPPELGFLQEILPNLEYLNDDSAEGGAGTADDVSPYEKWELERMAAVGVGDRAALFSSLVETSADACDVELNPQEASFLRGRVSQLVSSEAVKVAQIPEGSLAFAATAQSALAKERREVQVTEAKQKLELVPTNINEAWLDPMADPGQRQLAHAVMEQTQPVHEMPEWKQATFGKSTGLGQRTNQSIQQQRESLPVYQLRNQLMDCIRHHQVVVVLGETGSGKTTQIPQYLYEDGYAFPKKVGCTQPRRVAATSVATRVAEEQGCLVGQKVGYSIRFDDCTSTATQIKYMTDGMLLRECLVDKNLSAYSVLMLDEAHERSINTDVLFGLLKDVMRRRPDLKLIVTSATLNAEKFSAYFGGAPIFNIPGRTFPVEKVFLDSPVTDYLEASLITVLKIHLKEPKGDILLFLTGQEEIDTACEILFSRMKEIGGPKVPPLIILPVYSALPAEVQTRIFEPAPKGSRKVIIATNIAETSLTIDGIFYVVDPGFVKLSVYNPKLGMDSLEVTPISRASAEQRAGRAGRTGPGRCYRLYTKEAFEKEMQPETQPELQRTNLANTVLTLKAIGIDDLINFPFLDPPPETILVTALHQLYVLGALDEEGFLTRVGRKMAEFPLEPPLSKMLLTSVALQCSAEVITIIAMLSVESPFFRPKEKQAEADQKKAKFFQSEGDHIMLLTLYDAWTRSNYSNSWCHQNFIQNRAMKRARDVRQQVSGLMDRFTLPIVSCGRKYTAVRKAITAGFFTHIAKRAQDGFQTLIEGQTVYMHPSSSLFQRSPDWVLYHELVLTTKEYMRNCMVIEPKWLVELAPRFYRVSDPDKLSQNKRRERIQPLYDRFAAHPDDWRISRHRNRLN